MPEAAASERRMAILIPCWDEAPVIARMIDHNLAAINYSAYEVFVGVYPNDAETRRQVARLVRRHERVHLAEVPHDGPTSKADCLNWLYQRMQMWEEEHSSFFELVVIHDAEDLIHPLALQQINRYAASYDMIQVPVLALPTPWLSLTHGMYCDDFAESQWKDLATRVSLGGFLPGCGVGTAFRREALECLADAESNRIFQPGALTEDYDNGLRLFQLGFRQIILPLENRDGGPLATREYFPVKASAAARQRARWVTGNALQAWEQHGWGGCLRNRWVQVWFFWRDRKGLWGGPLSLLCNLLLAYGGLSWGLSVWLGREWPLHNSLPQSGWPQMLLSLNLALFLERITVRYCAVSRVYGARFACGVPLRMVWSNWINAWASVRAIWMWGRSRVTATPLRWLKTEHAYPSRSALAAHKRRIEEVLITNGWCAEEDIDDALASLPKGMTLGEHLVASGRLAEEELFAALSLQQSVPRAWIEPRSVPRRVARMLPECVSEEWRVLPFRVSDGALELASPRVPDDEMHDAIQPYTRLSLVFHLVTPSHYDELRKQLLQRAGYNP